MPIRRAAATPTQEKAPSAAAEKEPDVTTKESVSTDEPAASSATAEPAEMEEAEATDVTEPTENGEKEDSGDAEPKASENKENKDDKCKDCAAGQCATHCYVLLLRLKDGYKYEKTKAKKVKRTIPAWASVAASKKVPVSNFAGTQHKLDNILVEAITSCNNRSGVSYQSVIKYIVKKYPGMELDKKKFLIKRALKKHVDNGTIRRLKGKGLSGTFAIGKQPVASKKAPQMSESLGDALPLIITRLCEPKEASYNLIKKYLEQHFPNLNIETRPHVLKSALVRAVEKGQLEQITGKGAKGTFQLKRTGNQVLLKGGALEDAITAAITAMNEPKTCSTTSLRKYLVDSNKDRKEHLLVACLRRTLKKCKVLGWMEQITGHGFTGTYQLSFPFYPSPTILYPDKFKDPPKKTPSTKRRQTVETSDEEESEESEEEESEDEAPPPRRRKSQKRPPPKAQRPPPAKKSRSTSRGRGRALAKKSPAKKVVPSSKRLASRTSSASKKETTPPPKATPVKRGAPAKKPKKPAVKKLAKRGSKRPAPKESSDEEDEEEEEGEEEEEEEEEVVKETTRGGSKRSKPSESSPKPAAKKQASRSRSSRPESSPAKKGAKSNKSTRKSKRGRR